MRKQLLKVLANQHGSVINVALLILILIFLIGIGLSKMSTTDIKIANNIKRDMTTFYGADAGLDEAGEMIEQNLACITGFRDTADNFPDGTTVPVGDELIGGLFYVPAPRDFAHNSRDMAEIPLADQSNADFYTLPDASGGFTNFTVGGASRFSKGSAIQMAAGYEGLGKGAGAGGASVIFDVYSQRIGGDNENNSAVHFMQWVHILGSSGSCYY